LEKDFGSLKAFYEFHDPDKDCVVEIVRVAVTLTESVDSDTPDIVSFEWSVRLEDDVEYLTVEVEEFKTIITEDRHATLQQLAATLSIASVLVKSKKKTAEEIANRFIDRDDPLFKDVLVGDIEAPQLYYWQIEKEFPDLKNNPIRYPSTKSQISKLRYCLVRQKFLGYQLAEKKVIQLPLWWIEKTFPPEFIDTVKEEAVKGRKRFFDVPIGDSCTVIPTMDISMNPCVFYQQKKEPTCVFSSFASVLKFLKFDEMADFAIKIGEEILSDPKAFDSRRMEAFMGRFKSSKCTSSFWRKYGVVKLKRDFNLFENKASMEPKDILLISLLQSDSSLSHAVSIVGEYVFDSNVERALPFTLEGLNCCCEDSEFIGIAKGYWFYSLDADCTIESVDSCLLGNSIQSSRVTMEEAAASQHEIASCLDIDDCGLL